MLGTIFRSFVVLVIVLAITGFVGLFIMAGVASTHDVVPIPVPSSSYLAALKGDYTSAFRVPLTYNTYRDIAEVAEQAYRLGGREIHRGEHEVVYEAYRGGIRYFTAYLFDSATDPNTLTVVTLVRVHGTRAAWLWKLARPVHKRLSPYLLDRMAQAASV
jgi:hypothetical protein